MEPQRLSIAMCTYNGAAYIQQQLDSLTRQSRQPDELIVCDDGSRDDTLRIVQRFAAQAPFEVRVYENETNLGVDQNFDRAIGLCGGDIIFLCDQDDVWEPQKLARFERVFMDSPAVGLVFCDAQVMDDQLRPLGYRHWKAVGFPVEHQSLAKQGRGFEVLIRHSFVAGATLAFRSQYRSLIHPIPNGWAFDAWIALMISAVSPTGLVVEPMNQYRQHPKQKLGTAKKGFWRKYREAKQRVDAAYFEAMTRRHEVARDRLLAFDPALQGSVVLERLDAKIRLCARRSRMRAYPWLRFPLVVAGLVHGDYHREGHGWRTALLDIVI